MFFFFTLDRDSGSGVLLDQNPKRRSERMHGIENSTPPKKTNARVFGRQKRLLHQTTFAPKKLLLLHQKFLRQKTFYIH